MEASRNGARIHIKTGGRKKTTIELRSTTRERREHAYARAVALRTTAGGPRLSSQSLLLLLLLLLLYYATVLIDGAGYDCRCCLFRASSKTDAGFQVLQCRLLVEYLQEQQQQYTSVSMRQSRRESPASPLFSVGTSIRGGIFQRVSVFHK